MIKTTERPEKGKAMLGKLTENKRERNENRDKDGCFGEGDRIDAGERDGERAGRGKESGRDTKSILSMYGRR